MFVANRPNNELLLGVAERAEALCSVSSDLRVSWQDRHMFLRCRLRGALSGSAAGGAGQMALPLWGHSLQPTYHSTRVVTRLHCAITYALSRMLRYAHADSAWRGCSCKEGGLQQGALPGPVWGRPHQGPGALVWRAAALWWCGGLLHCGLCSLAPGWIAAREGCRQWPRHLPQGSTARWAHVPQHLLLPALSSWCKEGADIFECSSCLHSFK